MLKIENMTFCESISELYVQGIKDINEKSNPPAMLGRME